MNIDLLRKGIAAVFWTGLSIVAAFGQQTEPALRDRPITLHRENASLALIMVDLIEDFDVPVGFEESSLDHDHDDYFFDVNLPCWEDCFDENGRLRVKTPKDTVVKVKNHLLTIDADNEPLARVLDRIVAQMGYYRWEIVDDVVNIIPSEGRDKRFEALLDLRIPHFKNVDYQKRESKHMDNVRWGLALLPEVVDFFKENNIRFSTEERFTQRRELSVPIEYRDLTLRQLLNRYTKLKRGGWAVKINHKKMNEWKQKPPFDYVDIFV
ncbi:MAG: hypothetical protein JSS81_10950 [Acidobacteria bacterium]|nr:hypothetical protein [Acidobacteriota bacterium]